MDPSSFETSSDQSSCEFLDPLAEAREQNIFEKYVTLDGRQYIGGDKNTVSFQVPTNIFFAP